MKRCFIALVSLLALSISLTQAQNTPANRFGIVEGFWFPDLTCELGVGWERIIFDWSQHQPESSDDWHTLNVDDRWLKSASLCGREVVALIKNTPAWATDGSPGVGVPRGLDLPIDDSSNVWANFVKRAAGYYASRGINHFIIWNEPDIESDTYGYEFEGELEDYFKLLKVAYLAAKEANPYAVIHLAGTTYWHDVNEGRRPYMEHLIERIVEDPNAAAHGYYFDVLSLHIYFRTASITDLVGIMREMLDKHGLYEKAIWINETNAAPTIDPKWNVNRPVYQLDLEMQSAFLLQATALALASNVERIAVYKLYDQNLPTGAESFGILSPADATPRPAFYTWRTITQIFSDVVSATHASSANVTVVNLKHTGGNHSIVAWANTSESTNLKVIVESGDKTYQHDLDGNRTIVRSSDNAIELPLGGASCTETDGCFIGGYPIILSISHGNIRIYEITSTGEVELN